MNTPRTLITAFYTRPVRFFKNTTGDSMVEVFDINSSRIMNLKVETLARNIIRHKRQMARMAA
jgi:hypothetical protein